MFRCNGWLSDQNDYITVMTNVYEKERNLFTRCYYMNLNDEKWLYSLETILYNKKTTTILNYESVLLILIMEIIASTKI